MYFNSNNILHRINNPNETMLTAFFKSCREDEFASTLLREEVASYYTWNAHTWKTMKYNILSFGLRFNGKVESGLEARRLTFTS